MVAAGSSTKAAINDKWPGAGLSGQNREWFREVADCMQEMVWMSDYQQQRFL